jgi:hypothetical protein
MVTYNYIRFAPKLQKSSVRSSEYPLFRWGQIPSPEPCDKNGSLESETVKYDREPYGPRTRK